jgi:hypothetical protein
MKNANREKRRVGYFPFPFSTLHFNFFLRSALFERPIHKRKKSSALRTDAGGQGLGK